MEGEPKMKDHKITLTFEGTEEGGHIRLNDFLNELSKFIEITRKAEELVSSRVSRSIYYRIVDLKHTSPASLTLEACLKDPNYDIREAIHKEIFSTMDKLQKGEDIREKERFYLVESIRDFSDPIGKHVSKLNVIGNGNVINVSEEFKARAHLFTAPEESCHSTFRGMLDIINIHGPEKLFWLYPEIGPTRIQCKFHAGLFEDAKTALGKRVEVQGLFKYKIRAPYPHEAEVDNLETLPSDHELPTLKDLLGIDPDITGGLSSEDYIRKIRDAS
jgi:hypothetical protein